VFRKLLLSPSSRMVYTPSFSQTASVSIIRGLREILMFRKLSLSSLIESESMGGRVEVDNKQFPLIGSFDRYFRSSP
jgi:hypothetical protein